MNTLFFDVALDKLRVCLISDKKTINYVGESANGKIAEALLPKIEEILSKEGVEISDIDNVVVGVGPGSFTGVRIAVSTAKGLFATGKVNVYNVTSFEMLSYSEVEMQNLVIITKAFSSLYYASIFGNSCCETISEIKKKINGKDCIVLCEESLKNELYDFNTKIVNIDAEKIIKNVLQFKKPIAIHELEPLYLRASQAEIELQKKKGGVL